MTDKSDPRRSMDEVRRAVQQAGEQAAAAGKGTNIRVARRENIQVAVNTGESNSVQEASATQDAPIVQIVQGDARADRW